MAYLKAGPASGKAAVPVVMAALRDGRKVMVSALPGYSESAQGWSGVLQDIKRAG